MPTSFDTIPPFPKDGVTLSLLDEIIATFGESNLAGLTTTKVNEMFVKPYCSNTKLSLCDQLKSAGNPGVKRANVFISHAWSCIFLEVIDALKNHFLNVANKTDIVIWFDLFSNNQLLAPNLDFNWWATTFKEAIHEFGYTLMILAPWKNPTPLTRAWCLYEIYCTVETNSKFEVAMSDEEETDFSNVLCSDFDAVNKLLAIVNVSNSQCYKIEDRQRIFHAIENGVGFKKINTLIFSRLREWVIDVVNKKLIVCSDKNQKIGLMMSLAELYRQQNKLTNAEKLFHECYDLVQKEFGTNHVISIIHLGNLANVYMNMGRFKESEKILIHCLDHMKAKYGNRGLHLTNYLNGIGEVLKCQGLLTESETYLEECLSILLEYAGKDNQETLLLMNNLGGLYRDQRYYEKAELLYKECVQLKENKMGRAHPDTLLTIYGLALTYKVQGKNALAKELYEECVERGDAMLGSNHRLVVVCKHDLECVNLLISD